jgi:hypothetical protein
VREVNVDDEMRQLLREGEEALEEEPWVLSAVPSRPHPEGSVRTIEDIAHRCLGERAEAFLFEIRRWRGPHPYPQKQRRFLRSPWKDALDAADLERVLSGETRVMVDPEADRVHLVMRDHHTLDALLYLYDAFGWMPDGPLLHLDRHSDFEPIVAWHGQANGWWSLLPFLRRPEPPHEAIVDVARVIYGTALATAWDEPLPGPLNGAHLQVPPTHRGADLSLERALSEAIRVSPDLVSVDLDLFMPDAQRRLAGWILDDPRYRRVVARARASLFVLSPQFARGGDEVPPIVQASVEAFLDLLACARA